MNALAAADRVLVPVQAEYYALEGLAQLVGSVELVRARLNPKLTLGGVILTMVDRRTRLASDVSAEVRRHFGELVFKTSVPRSVRVAEAPSHGLPVTAYDRDSAGADAYWKVAMELVGSVELVRSRLNPGLAIGGVILTMVDRRTRLAADVSAEVRRHFGELVFRTAVPRSVRVAEAPSHGLPVTAYDRDSAGADAYWKVAMELVGRS